MLDVALHIGCGLGVCTLQRAGAYTGAGDITKFEHFESFSRGLSEIGPNSKLTRSAFAASFWLVANVYAFVDGGLFAVAVFYAVGRANIVSQVFG